MATSTPVAFNTRSRLRRRKDKQLQDGLPPRRKPRQAQVIGEEGQAKENSNATNNIAPEAGARGGGGGGGREMDKDVSKAPLTDIVSAPAEAANGEAIEPPVTVLHARELTPLEDCEGLGARVEGLLGLTDWIEQYDSATLLRRCVAFHPKEAKESVYSHLESVLPFLTIQLESLRSAQIRNALFAVRELFAKLPDTALLTDRVAPHLKGVIDAVVMKSVNDKRFIASAGEAALESMILSASSLAVLLPLLEHATSKSSKVCSVVSRFCARCLSGMVGAKSGAGAGAARLLGTERSRMAMVRGFAALEMSRSVDAKKPAQQSLRLLHRTLGAAVFESAIEGSLSPTSGAHVLSLVRKPEAKETRKAPSLRELMAEKRREQRRKGDASSDKAGDIVM